MTRLEKIAAFLACSACVGWTSAHLVERAFSGVRFRVEKQASPEGQVAAEMRAPHISSDVLLFTPNIGPAPARATFRGFLWTQVEGPVEFRLRGDTPGRLWLDDALVLPPSGGNKSDRTMVRMRRGLHHVRAELDTAGKLPVFRVTVADEGDSEGAEPMLFPSPPRPLDRFLVGRLVPWLRTLGRVLGLAAAALGLWLVFGWSEAVRLPATGISARGVTVRVWVCALAVVTYAGLLRMESVVRQYWGLDAPSWARRAAEVSTGLRPSALKHTPAERPYFGDPTTYLRFAREMERFYDPHVREPLFVAATKGALSLSDGRDIAISLTSAAFSTLLVGATVLMGARAFGPGVGLVAASLLAVEHDVLRLSAEGWRDDTFAFWVAAFAAALLALLARPSFGRALVLGLTGGAAALTRITALSFLLPAFGFAGWASRRDARGMPHLVLAVLITAVLLAPFLLTSKVAFDDPLHAINAHTRFYRSRASLPAETPMSWNDYLWQSFTPAALARNLATGLTVNPFENKWQPFAIWARPAPRFLRWLSIIGLVLFLRSRNGRLLLVVLFGALTPFAFTFRVKGGDEWRFTLLAYPFYLVAAALTLDRARAWLVATFGRDGREQVAAR
jgi:hypothetical protein